MDLSNHEWYKYEVGFYGFTVPLYLAIVAVLGLFLILIFLRKRQGDKKTKTPTVQPENKDVQEQIPENKPEVVEIKKDESPTNINLQQKYDDTALLEELKVLRDSLRDFEKRFSCLYSLIPQVKNIIDLEGFGNGPLNRIEIRNNISALLEYAKIDTSTLNPRSPNQRDSKINISILEYISKKMDDFDNTYNTVVFKSEHYNLVGCAFFLSGRTHDAQRFFDKALVANKDISDVWSNKGACLLDLDRYDEALDAFNKALELDSSNYYACMGIGLIHLERADVQKALDFFKRATICNPRFPDAWYEAGAVLSNMKRYNEAINFFNNAILIDNSDERPLLLRAVALSAIGRHEEAFASYEDAIKIKPDLEDSWYGRAIELSYLGLHKDAIESFDYSLILNRQNFKAWFGKGLSHHYLNEHDSAIKAFEESIRLNEGYAKAWFYLAICYTSINDSEKAKESLLKAISIDERYRQKALSIEGLRSLISEMDRSQ
ncbi:MAG: tetratricopeptide repeat protein [Thermodesulfovibrionales bacterium]